MRAAGNHAHPMGYFEVPVADLERAIGFYTAVFGFHFERETIDGYEMALLPRDDDAPGASGALAKGDAYVPSKDGVIIYFSVEDIDGTLRRAEIAGGSVLYPKTDPCPARRPGAGRANTDHRKAAGLQTGSRARERLRRERIL